jgi:pantoate kinase
MCILTFKKVSSGSEKNLQKNPVLALKSPSSAHFMSFSIKFTNSFSISKNAFIDEYREFSGRVYTHPNKRSLLNS